MFLAFDDNADDTGVLVLGEDRTSLAFRGGDLLLFLDAEVLTEKGDAFFAPLDFPEVTGLTGLDAAPMQTFGVRGSEFFEQVSGKTERQGQGFFFHSPFLDEERSSVKDYNKVGVGGFEPADLSLIKTPL